ncbi:MAG: hypothetical protein M1831_000942 [Alyxoria varia]|nr:MAG: hypothetical protein M1831_000942 [Alyxoria varia]
MKISLIGKIVQGSTATQSATSPTKKGASDIPSTALGQLLSGAGPLRSDGSDKFFGMNNFRQHVLDFPVNASQTPRVHNATNEKDVANLPNGGPPGSPAKTPQESHSSFFQRKLGTTPTSPQSSSKQELGKESSHDNQKKQAFANGPLLHQEITYHGSYGMPQSLFTCLKDLFGAIVAHESHTGVIVPAKFLEVLKANNESYRGNVHQDAHEFLNLLLNDVVEQVDEFSKKLAATDNESNSASEPAMVKGARPLNSLADRSFTSWIHDLFEGTLTSETRCLTCENVSQRDEIFLDLSVDTEEHSSVTSSLKKFSEEEMLCERNKFYCDKCYGLQEAEKRMKIKRLPRILALHLKRFKYSYVDSEVRFTKVFHRVVFPFHLRLSNTTDDAEDPDRLYELYAVIVHIGALPSHGHYVAIIKTRERGWLLFDDELVLPVDSSYIRNFFGTGYSNKNPACAYVLFYQQADEESIYKEQDNVDSIAEETPTFNDEEPLAMVNDGEENASPTFKPQISQQSPLDDQAFLDTLENPTAYKTLSRLSKPESHPPPPAITTVSSAPPDTGSVRVVNSPTKHYPPPSTKQGFPHVPLSFTDPQHLNQDNVPIATRPLPSGEEGKHNNSLFSSSKKSHSTLSRFRNTSLSLRTKPKFFGGGSKDQKDQTRDLAKQEALSPNGEDANTASGYHSSSPPMTAYPHSAGPLGATSATPKTPTGEDSLASQLQQGGIHSSPGKEDMQTLLAQANSASAAGATEKESKSLRSKASRFGLSRKKSSMNMK